MGELWWYSLRHMVFIGNSDATVNRVTGKLFMRAVSAVCTYSSKQCQASVQHWKSEEQQQIGRRGGRREAAENGELYRGVISNC